MAILQATQNSTTIAGIPPSSSLNTALTATQGSTTPSSADTELPSYQFIAGWILLFVILTFVNKTRLGHVAIYYSLLLMILLILVTEYQQIVPILNSISTIGQFNAKKSV